MCGADEHTEWSETIEAALSREYPDLNPNAGIPANHPYWARRNELWAPHEQACALFAYDAWSLNLCAAHLRTLADAVAGWEAGRRRG